MSYSLLKIGDLRLTLSDPAYSALYHKFFNSSFDKYAK